MNSLSVNILLQKLAITVTHPFRRIRSFEDCLAERVGFEPSEPVTQYARLAIRLDRRLSLNTPLNLSNGPARGP